MFRGFFGNLIFTIIAQMLCAKHVDLFLEFFFEGVSLTGPCCSYLRGFSIHGRLAVCAVSVQVCCGKNKTIWKDF